MNRTEYVRTVEKLYIRTLPAEQRPHSRFEDMGQYIIMNLYGENCEVFRTGFTVMRYSCYLTRCGFGSKNCINVTEVDSYELEICMPSFIPNYLNRCITLQATFGLISNWCSFTNQGNTMKTEKCEIGYHAAPLNFDYVPKWLRTTAAPPPPTPPRVLHYHYCGGATSRHVTWDGLLLLFMIAFYWIWDFVSTHVTSRHVFSFLNMAVGQWDCAHGFFNPPPGIEIPIEIIREDYAMGYERRKRMLIDHLFYLGEDIDALLKIEKATNRNQLLFENFERRYFEQYRRVAKEKWRIENEMNYLIMTLAVMTTCDRTIKERKSFERIERHFKEAKPGGWSFRHDKEHWRLVRKGIEGCDLEPNPDVVFNYECADELKNGVE